MRMKTYIISIAAATVISAIVTIITPKRWEKYVKVVTGLVVTICIAEPIIGIMKADVFDGFDYEIAEHEDMGESLFLGELRLELEDRLREDIKSRLKTEFNRECTAEVEVSVNGNRIDAVKSILVYGDKIDAVVIGRLREVYGAREVRYVGTEKTAQKQE